MFDLLNSQMLQTGVIAKQLKHRQGPLMKGNGTKQSYTYA